MCVPVVASAWSVERDGLTYTSFRSDHSTYVSVKLSNFTKTDVTIPATITYDNQTYKVTKIEDMGFTQEVITDMVWDDNTQTYTSWKGSSPLWGMTNEYGCNNKSKLFPTTLYNGTLKSVTFEQPSNVTRIGCKAFEGCVGLTSFTVPNSVTDLGTTSESDGQVGRAFYACINLSEFHFQTKEDGTIGITVIPDETFSTCYKLAGIEIPEGVTEIKPRAFQFNFSLTSIKLPNTLTIIGSHFLCDASSLQTLTIPSSVTMIDGAFLHGCESLKTVYLLGSPSALTNVVVGETGVSPFTANPTNYCRNRVSYCDFYVSSENYGDYTTATGWKDVYQGEGKERNEDNHCRYVKIDNTRKFDAGRWVTAIFPHEVANMETTFGGGTKAAKMIKAEPTADDRTLYHVTFQLLSGKTIPAATPLMFNPVNPTNYKLYEANELENADFKADMTKAFTEKVTATDGAIVSMIGLYTPQALSYLDFYFMSNKFYRVPQAGGITLGAYRCYWQIKTDGVLSSNAKVFSFDFDDSNVTGISDITAKNTEEATTKVYTIDGRRVGMSVNSLPKGLYIMGGKKVLVK